MTRNTAQSRWHRRPAAFNRFWQRLSDGLEAQQLWNQFRAEARSSYEFYSQDVDWDDLKKKRGIRWGFRMASAWFWAIVMKLSPSRRVALVLALLLASLGDVQFNVRTAHLDLDFRSLGFLLLLVLLGLELSDRVTMKRDLQIARDIQRWLAPAAPPQVPGIDISFMTTPANTVSGDYYDAFLLDEDKKRLLLIVADVAGKGVPAAILMASLQTCLHSCASDSREPLPLVARLNDFACTRSLEGQRFTTAFLAELDVETRELQYVNAGHEFPVLRRANGSIERLETGGLPLGVTRQATHECGTTRLEPGDLLFVFSDGLVDAPNAAGAPFGDERVVATVRELGGESAEGAIRSMIERVDRFSGETRRDDDITCLTLRVV
ncbi:MAG TPA: PP2C family protein-serine/threonine phosphatase [Candidatus Krumholzibacteria bacterium]|nr:PP2C family protein-serine/threonine phosphatase [Candidatus Krumholzibacteria bacterium]